MPDMTLKELKKVISQFPATSEWSSWGGEINIFNKDGNVMATIHPTQGVSHYDPATGEKKVVE